MHYSDLLNCSGASLLASAALQSYKNVLIKMDMDFLTLFLSNSEAHKTNNAKMNKVSRIKMDTKGSRFTFYCPEHLKRNHEID